jgi:hypothetical protein
MLCAEVILLSHKGIEYLFVAVYDRYVPSPKLFRKAKPDGRVKLAEEGG